MSILDKLGITKGPWISEHRKMGITNGTGDEVYGTQIFTKDMVIADMHWCPLKTEYGYKSMRDENATLIATTPEMLEALIDSIIMIEEYETNHINQNGIGVSKNATRYHKYISVIEKATGKKWKEIEELLDE